MSLSHTEDTRPVTLKIPIFRSPGSPATGRLSPGAPLRGGFTLVELMVTIAIIGVLLSLLAPALQRTIASARGFKCQTTLRNIAFDFALFADPTVHGSRGADAQLSNRFRIATFQESEYGSDEFWTHGNASEVTFEAGDRLDHMRCTEVSGAVTLRRNLPCTTAGSIGPSPHVSFGFNARLNRVETQGPFGIQATPVFLTSDIMQESDVPLLWDVDGALAQSKGVLTPQFSAPALDSQFLYVNDKHWFPAMRHGGAMNVAFVGGHVISTRAPLEEPGWRWDYSPR